MGTGAGRHPAAGHEGIEIFRRPGRKGLSHPAFLRRSKGTGVPGEPAVGNPAHPLRYSGSGKLGRLGGDIPGPVEIHQRPQGQRRKTGGVLLPHAGLAGVFPGAGIGSHHGQIGPGGLAPQGGAAMVVAVGFPLLPQEPQGRLQVLHGSGESRLPGQAVVDGGAGVAMVPEIPVEQLGLVGLGIVHHKAASMDQHQQRRRRGGIGHIQVEPLGGRGGSVDQVPVGPASRPGGVVRPPGGGRQIVPDGTHQGRPVFFPGLHGISSFLSALSTAGNGPQAASSCSR